MYKIVWEVVHETACEKDNMVSHAFYIKRHSFHMVFHMYFTCLLLVMFVAKEDCSTS